MPRKPVLFGMPSPTHVMCLIGKGGSLVTYLRQDWASSPRHFFTTKVNEAWSCSDPEAAEKMAVGMSDLLKLTSELGRFELRKRGSCPDRVKFG